ncbi:AraC family transcriptional regulator [Algoriphagus aestuariicola]|jgi:AraC-like DNA-binding protein|uniref:AraC family transcriptional regulator n=1 Tax=Algoriphagus aestuariicola TaxID=1852016 RepID=A0ABS3BV18_9BACT|nr:helix-turn-helix domain-containing protein [Algoriphagus aestuariicola]MBN7802684.1 AraC family transcriptional regulator [Algoriphagus aestuariicola]
MELDLSLINILILFGAVQGMTFMIALFASSKHPGAKFLALAVLALVYNGLETFNWSSNLEQYTRLFDYFPFVLIFLVGPSFYLYQYSLLRAGTAPSRKRILISYSPFIFQFTYLAFCWIGYLLTKSELLNFQPWLRSAGQFYAWYSEPVSVLVFLFFFSLSVWDFRKNHRAALLDKRCLQPRKIAVDWAKQLLVFQFLMSLIWPATVIISYFDFWPFSWSEYYPVELLLVLFLYWIAIAGYFRMRSITVEPIRKKEKPSQNEPNSPEMDLILRAMEIDELYRNPELNLSLLSEKTGLPSKTLSKILNQSRGVNFNDFVNSYRVEAFCREAEKAENSKLTLQGIAFDCGFNSSATFQRTFKKFKGDTPKSYFQARKKVE